MFTILLANFTDNHIKLATSKFFNLSFYLFNFPLEKTKIKLCSILLTYSYYLLSPSPHPHPPPIYLSESNKFYGLFSMLTSETKETQVPATEMSCLDMLTLVYADFQI